MDNPRLLTDEELGQVEKSRGWWELQTRKAVMSAQDQKTAALVEAATLRAVGEWLKSKHMVAIDRFDIGMKDIEALLRGETPAGWERK